MPKHSGEPARHSLRRAGRILVIELEAAGVGVVANLREWLEAQGDYGAVVIGGVKEDGFNRGTETEPRDSAGGGKGGGS